MTPQQAAEILENIWENSLPRERQAIEIALKQMNLLLSILNFIKKVEANAS